LRRWPDHRAWAHGGAAKHQLRAERSAERLGGDFPDDLAKARLSVRRNSYSPAGPALRVFRETEWIYSVWEQPGRVVNLRRPCICPAGNGRSAKVIRSCGDHGETAVALAFALRDWEYAERQFWGNFRGIPCCGTMDRCPLTSFPAAA
jgi:hypothetical protein